MSLDADFDIVMSELETLDAAKDSGASARRGVWTIPWADGRCVEQHFVEKHSQTISATK